MTDRTSSAIGIAADRASVMAVIADFGAYPEWASGVRETEVLEAAPDGRARRVRFRVDAGVIKDGYVLAYEWDGDRSVRWQLAEAGSMVSDLSGAYHLDDDGGSTTVSYELAVGTKVPLLGLIKRRAEKTIIDTALRGLKSRVEAGPRPGGR